MTIFSVLCVFLALAAIVEYSLHLRTLRRIPVRIQVNGTRGKSTTTRLIAAGLRGAGLRVIAKTTGTAPSLILEDGSEQLIKRRGRANISEQMRVARFAASRGADAIVLECMALEPENQWVAEHQMVRSTIGVITNVREDHLDVMGPTLRDVGEALALTVPRGGALVTAESEMLPIFEAAARRLGAEVHVVDGSEIADEVNEEFEYVSFKENVACALAACELASVPRDVALEGMLRAEGDPGAMRIIRVERNGLSYVVANAFAANDYTSTLMIWRMLTKRFEIVAEARAGQARPVRSGADREAPGPRALHGTEAQAFATVRGGQNLPIAVVMNNRADRLPRIGELAPLVAQVIQPAKVFLIGQAGRVAARRLAAAGVRGGCIIDLTSVADPEEVMQRIAESLPAGALLFAMGNTKGMGLTFADYSERNGESL